MQEKVQAIASEENNVFWSLYKLFIFFDLLVSFRAWFTWSIDSFKWSLLSILIGSCFFFGAPKWYTRKIPWIWFVLLLLSVVTGSLYLTSFSVILHNTAPILPLFFILALRPRYKENLLTSITKYMSILVGISLIGWILYLIGVPSLSFPVGYGEDEYGRSHYIFENHILFLRSLRRMYDDSFLRFSSVFLEPGYLGCLMAMLLYIGRFKKNTQNAVFLLALLFSMSLAGYIIFVVTFCGYSIIHARKQFNYIVLGAIFVLMLYGFGIFYNNGDNPIKKRIIDRLEYDNLEQRMSGYNRSSEEVNDYFWTYFVKSENVLFGGDGNYESSGTVDWRTYILTHGLISFVLFICYLAYPVLENRRKRYNIALLSALYFMVFVSTFHLSISMMYLSLFSLGVGSLRRNDDLNSRIRQVIN